VPPRRLALPLLLLAGVALAPATAVAAPAADGIFSPSRLPLGAAPGQQPVFTNVTLTRTITQGGTATLRLTVADAASVAIRVRQGTVTRIRTSAPVVGGTATKRFGARLPPGAYTVVVSVANAAGSTRATRKLTVKPKPSGRSGRHSRR